ncbi:hypothetical protein [Paractinoplanes durhamensis]|uniref:Uncharacterized protein n=1 Tax=Paractinoplanes durhamensis TaxID=113563 RepID=A0ABQ3ZAT3_9ACTN|nr:hypothetical protein [Actinoplanes durhamensis]GIE06941.1 hypothetical protein Adu01nite_82910 [Actinoplanes durhamensis]
MMASYERRPAFIAENRNPRMRAGGERIGAYLAAYQGLRAAHE